MRIHQTTAEAALASLNVSDSGLTPAAAASRLTQFGPNVLPRAGSEPWLRRFLREFISFFALVLWLAAGLAFWAGFHQPESGMTALGWAVTAVVLINGMFSYIQVARARKAIGALSRLLPRQVRVIRQARALLVDAAILVPGDVVLLGAGDQVPADCRVIQAFGFRVVNAVLTGEARPVSRTAAVSATQAPLEAANLVWAGTTVAAGEARALVYATGKNTEFGRIAAFSQLPRRVRIPLETEIRRLSRLITAMACGLGLAIFLAGRSVGLPVWECMLFAIGMIVANVPEGLLPTLTLALAMGAQRMARRGVLIKNLPAVEALGSVSVICTDKTGTLTENRMHVAEVGHGSERIDATGGQRNSAALGRLSRGFWDCLHHCHDLAGADGGGWLGDPTEVALVTFAQAGPYPDSAGVRLDVLPFDSDRRRMTVLWQHGDGRRLAYTKGAPEVVLPLCRLQADDKGQAPLTAADRERILGMCKQMAASGLRVLAVAGRTDPAGSGPGLEALEQDLTFFGIVGLHDPPRSEVPQAIKVCMEAGIRTVMVTGDHSETAVAIASRIGMVRGDSVKVVTSEELSALSDAALQLVLGASRENLIFARVSAAQKFRIVEAFQRRGEIVAVTGDGVNDVPALKQADIGVAMGRGGTDAAREAADIVITDDNFSSIVAGIEEGRAAYLNVRKFLTYILTSNIPEVVPYLAFALFKVPLALSVLQILAIDLGTDMVPAIALGAEPPEAGIMRRPPRPRSERLLTGRLLLRAYGFLGMLQAAGAMTMYFVVLHAGGWRHGGPGTPSAGLQAQASAACLAAVVVMQVANALVCRFEMRSVFGGSWPRNRLLWLGIGLELCLMLALVYLPGVNQVFGTAAFPAWIWLPLLALAPAFLLFEELRKAVARSFGGKSLTSPRAS